MTRQQPLTLFLARTLLTTVKGLSTISHKQRPNRRNEVVPVKSHCLSSTVVRGALLSLLWPAAGIPFIPAASAQAMLEEVIVTARKKEESLQETPVAVSAFGPDALKEAGIKNLADFNKAVPGLDVNETNGNAPTANIYIRGVGQRNTGANIDSGVGVYLDGIYLARPDGALLDINDISSVQILRGPQGTLFGKNTTGGAVVFTTTRPSDEFEGSVSLRGGSYDERGISAVLNVPITDRLASRLSVVARQRDGYIDNEFLDKDFVDEDRQAAIFKLRFEASDDLQVDMIMDYSRVASSPRPLKCMVVPGVTGWLAELLDAVVVTPATGRKIVDFCRDNQEAGGGDLHVVESSLDAEYLAKTKGISLQFDWDISDTMNFKSITGYRNTLARQDDDIGATAIPFHRDMSAHPITEPRDTDQFSQEFQLTGELLDGGLRYITGMYLFREETSGSIYRTIVASPMEPTIAGPTSFFLNVSATQTLATNSAGAVFSQLEWAMTSHLNLIGGLRFTTEKREVELNTFVPDVNTINGAEGGMNPIPVAAGIYLKPLGPFELNPDFGFVPSNQFAKDVEHSELTPMISLQYLLDDSGFINGGNAYLTLSRGFQSGGINESPGGLGEFDPEQVTNLELGLKLDLWNRRLRLNTALFHMRYTDRQLTTIVIDPNTSSPSGTTINAEKSSITGLELESTTLLTDNLMLLVNAAWTRGEIDKFEDTRITLVEDTNQPPPANCNRVNLAFVQVDECQIDRSDEDLPRLAEYSAYVALQYTLNTDIGQFVPRIELSYKDNIEYCFDRGSCESGLFRGEDQTLLGANLSWFAPGDQLQVSLFGSNLTNEDFLVGGIALTDSFGTGGVNVVAPRMWGAEIAYYW